MIDSLSESLDKLSRRYHTTDFYPKYNTLAQVLIVPYLLQSGSRSWHLALVGVLYSSSEEPIKEDPIIEAQDHAMWWSNFLTNGRSAKLCYVTGGTNYQGVQVFD